MYAYFLPAAKPSGEVLVRPVGVLVGVELIRWIPPRYVHVYVHVEFTEVNYEVQFYFPF